ncbi:hypothetical protein LX16_2100 [Stackebrandtia albiflava]|uniref:Uncharacterized protein n=1 Tax=Stackebrandtia albiflava TaxID=406432 RepID=A0A562VEW6_9ACTN|nr:hypothetical protein [Stackebrandtia albiflava]TWJ16371.1 hypothetical protein LX16_2100 [Stackebrandtia albiflava]
MSILNRLADRALARLLADSTAEAGAGCPTECGAWSACVMSPAHCTGGWHRNRTCVNSACNTYTQVGCC